MKNTVPPQIESLFQRYPALCGFSVCAAADLPDDCPRSGDDGELELLVGDLGIAPSLGAEPVEEIFKGIAAALAELLAEQPEGARGCAAARLPARCTSETCTVGHRRGRC